MPDTSSHRLVLTKDIHALVHGAGAIGQLNAKLAVLITRGVGSMWCAYIFVLISLVSLPQAFAAFVGGDTVTGVSWISQTFFQLVLLSVILVGQNVISTAQDARTEADHETLLALQKINAQQLEILTRLDALDKPKPPA